MTTFVQDLATILSDRFGVPTEEFAEDRPMTEFGIDSLVAVELALFLQKSLGIELAPGDISAEQTPLEIKALVRSKGADVQ
ncbi:acyl carrier protein [Saccharothrix sp. S26]|uniref:acyl carrier protein n=1 Tax=Saccharothrix sp. S26 TaxID=2907215 RepID=UPI001F36C2CB|nr:acyl carrier protein [Saccharothrix sp. S26]MCE6996343.1 acyl carrier protein [Saccharothrix sp. S26]